MSQAASQAAAFYGDVAKGRVLWTVRDEGGFPAPMNSSGERAQPFWSSRSRVGRIIKKVPAYADFEPVEVSWDEFCEKWIPVLKADGMKVGVNWSGSHARGYDLAPDDVFSNVEAAIEGRRNPEDDDLSEPTDCMQCGKMIPAGANRCGYCGWSYC